MIFNANEPSKDITTPTKPSHPQYNHEHTKKL